MKNDIYYIMFNKLVKYTYYMNVVYPLKLNKYKKY